MSLLLSIALSPAFGCSLLPPTTLTLDPSVEDDVPPAPPELVAVEVTRGRGPRPDGMSTSCDDLGFLTVTVARPEGDPDGEDVVGYRMEHVGGTLPDDLFLPSRREEAPWLGPDLRLVWIDEPIDDQEPFDFVLALIPVDVAGNEGEPATVRIEDDGRPDDLGLRAGCSVAPGSFGAIGAFVALAAARRRRV